MTRPRCRNACRCIIEEQNKKESQRGLAEIYVSVPSWRVSEISFEDLTHENPRVFDVSALAPPRTRVRVTLNLLRVSAIRPRGKGSDSRSLERHDSITISVTRENGAPSLPPPCLFHRLRLAFPRAHALLRPRCIRSCASSIRIFHDQAAGIKVASYPASIFRRDATADGSVSRNSSSSF